MREKVLSIIVLSMFLCIQANASITVNQATDPEYLINSGYSETTAEEVAIVKNRINGQPSEPLYQKTNNKFIRFCKNFYSYIDPSIDSEERFHHNIHQSPSWRDL